MKISIRQKLLFLSFFVLAGIGLMGYAVYKSNQNLLDTAQWVEHTEQVIYESGNILALAIDMETASRGFVITNDSTFLEPLNLAGEKTFVYIRQLRQLTQDNPAQQQRVDSLNFYMGKRLAYSLQAVELRSKQGLASAIAYTSTKEGKKYSDRLRQITNVIQQEEGLLLKDRKLANKHSAATFNLFSVIMFALMVVFTIFLLIATGSHFRQNEEKEKRAAELTIANKELAFQNGEKEKRADELIFANKELNQSKELLQDSLQEISDYKYALDESTIIAITDQKGTIKKANSNFCKISKYSREELIGQDHRIINSGYHSKEFIRDLWVAIANGKIWKGELKNKANDGTFYWVNTTIVPFLNKEGKPYQYLAIRVDITDRKETEEYLVQSAAQLKTVNEELAFQNEEKGKQAAALTIANKELKKAEDDIRKLNEELEQKVIDRTAQLESVNKELESFSYSVSHDLRAPIRAINGYAKILEEDYSGKFDADGTSALHSIMCNSTKMGDLIDDLLAFSKLGRNQVTVSEINMTAIVKSIREELISEDSENRNKFNVTALPPAKGDPSLIKQVWINLISNAIKYSKYKPKTNIEIGAYEKDKLVVYYVKDNGAGFDMQYYDKIFGVFQRLHSQEEFEGTGIGLAIVQKIVQRHNGTVWAESILNEGTCFYFSLPNINV